MSGDNNANAAGSPGTKVETMTLVELPAELLTEILCYLSYEDISCSVRLVNRKLREKCGSQLNTAFLNLHRNVLAEVNAIKVQLNNLF